MEIAQQNELFIKSYEYVYGRKPHSGFRTPPWKFVVKHGFSNSSDEIEDKKLYEHSHNVWLIFQYGMNAEKNLASLGSVYATSHIS